MLKTWRSSRRPSTGLDCAGGTVIQDQSYGFCVHQAKFVQERLSPIVIPRGRRSDKKSETSVGLGPLGPTRAVAVPCKICVTRIWQLSDLKPNFSLESSFHTFPFTRCVGLPFKTLPGQRRRGSQSMSFLGWCNFPRTVEQPPISLFFVESQVSLFETKVFQYVSCRNSDHVRGLGRGRVDSWAFRRVDQSQFQYC